MAIPSPLQATFEAAHATLMEYGPEPAPPGGETPAPISPRALVPASLGPLELEYASIRKACGLLDLPIRGVLEVTGPDRIDFLNRMLTQELKGIAPGSLRRSFWLSRKGRVDADLRVVHFADRTLLECDILALAHAQQTLGAFIITEDVVITDVSQRTHRLALHGPTAPVLLRAACTASEGPHPADLPEGGATKHAVIAGKRATIFRDDTAGVPGFEVICDAASAVEIFKAFIQHGHDPAHPETQGRALQIAGQPHSAIRLQPVGWHAYNIARVEAGTPLFNVDFGTQSLPAETGVLHERVSFTKGCYLGQEVVARMHSRKQSKQSLVAIRWESQADDDSPYPFCPSHAAPVAVPGADASAPEVVGVVTSAVLSPALGMAPIALAQVRTPHAAPGTVVITQAEGRTLRGVIAGEPRDILSKARGSAS